MKARGLAIGVALSTALAAPGLAKDDEPVYAASSPWTLDYDTDSCALRRMFGDGDDSIYLELIRFGPGPKLQALVASNRMKPRNPGKFKYRFDPAEAEWNDVDWAPTIKTDNGFAGVIFMPSLIRASEDRNPTQVTERRPDLSSLDTRDAEREFAAQTERLAIRGAFRERIVLRLGSMAQPIAALNECIAELMTHWDIDLEAHKTLTRMATPLDFEKAARMVSYPPKMAEKRMPGIVNVRLSIDETGRVSRCRVQMPLSDPEFEASSCADIQHAFEFEPALDKDGKPIASFWTRAVVFQSAFIGR